MPAVCGSLEVNLKSIQIFSICLLFSAPVALGQADSINFETVAEEIKKTVPGRQCFTVTLNGTKVYDRVYRGTKLTKNNAWSATKSAYGLLVGVAVKNGHISLDDFAPGSFTYRAAKVREILGMASRSANNQFAYDITGRDINRISSLIVKGSNIPIAQYARVYLLDPLEIKSNWNGYPLSGEWTCEDFAKFGQLYLNEGMWNGDELISSDYINEALAQSYPSNSAFGYLMWLNSSGNWILSIGREGSGTPINGAPENVYWAVGLFGQIMIVIPDLKMVVTTMGHTRGIDTLIRVQAVWDALSKELPKNL